MGNEVVEFEKGQKESKRAALERLGTLLNERRDTKATGNARSASPRGLRDDKRALTDMRKEFYALVDQDANLKAAFGDSKAAAKAPMVQRFRDQMLAELLQLVETALLESSS